MNALAQRMPGWVDPLKNRVPMSARALETLSRLRALAPDELRESKRRIASAVGLSESTLFEHLKHLINAGELPETARSAPWTISSAYFASLKKTTVVSKKTGPHTLRNPTPLVVGHKEASFTGARTPSPASEVQKKEAKKISALAREKPSAETRVVLPDAGAVTKQQLSDMGFKDSFTKADRLKIHWMRGHEQFKAAREAALFQMGVNLRTQYMNLWKSKVGGTQRQFDETKTFDQSRPIWKRAAANACQVGMTVAEFLQAQCEMAPRNVKIPRIDWLGSNSCVERMMAWKPREEVERERRLEQERKDFDGKTWVQIHEASIADGLLTEEWMAEQYGADWRSYG